MRLSQSEVVQQIRDIAASRLDAEGVDALIVGEKYFKSSDSLKIVCCLYLANGATSQGESTATRKQARENARDKVVQAYGEDLNTVLSIVHSHWSCHDEEK